MLDGPVFVKILVFWLHIFEGVEQRKLIIGDFIIQLVIGREFAFRVYIRR